MRSDVWICSGRRPRSTWHVPYVVMDWMRCPICHKRKPIWPSVARRIRKLAPTLHRGLIALGASMMASQAVTALPNQLIIALGLVIFAHGLVYKMEDRYGKKDD